MALFGYSLQVYADFSGYTDIAIGVAMLMGFYLPKNFNSPYKAKNPGEFWKRPCKGTSFLAIKQIFLEVTEKNRIFANE